MEEFNRGVRQGRGSDFKVLLEAPLAKPNSVNVFTPFDQDTICFAVDVSGSTEGVVLEEEKAAIEALAEELPTTTRQRCSIVPWDNDPDRYQASGLEGLQQLASFGGTDPIILLQNQAHRAFLQRSNVGFFSLMVKWTRTLSVALLGSLRRTAYTAKRASSLFTAIVLQVQFNATSRLEFRFSPSRLTASSCFMTSRHMN